MSGLRLGEGVREDPLNSGAFKWWVLEEAGFEIKRVVVRNSGHRMTYDAVEKDTRRRVFVKVQEQWDEDEERDGTEGMDAREVAVGRLLSGVDNAVPIDSSVVLWCEALNRWYRVSSEVFCDGMSLEELMTKAEHDELDSRKALEVIQMVLLDMKGYEQAGLVHRDIKPANLMLSGFRVIFLDWALGKRVDDPQDTNPEGTPEFIPPEQCEGGHSATSDVYSVGMMMYMFLTGHRPFAAEASSPYDYMRMHQSFTPALGFFPVELSPDTVDVFLALVRKDPKKRLTRAQAVEAVSELLKDGFWSERPAGFDHDDLYSEVRVAAAPWRRHDV